MKVSTTFYNADGDLMAPLPLDVKMASPTPGGIPTFDAGFYHAFSLSARTPAELQTLRARFIRRLAAVPRSQVLVAKPIEVRMDRFVRYGLELIYVVERPRARRSPARESPPRSAACSPASSSARRPDQRHRSTSGPRQVAGPCSPSLPEWRLPGYPREGLAHRELLAPLRAPPVRVPASPLRPLCVRTSGRIEAARQRLRNAGLAPETCLSTGENDPSCFTTPRRHALWLSPSWQPACSQAAVPERTTTRPTRHRSRHPLRSRSRTRGTFAPRRSSTRSPSSLRRSPRATRSWARTVTVHVNNIVTRRRASAATTTPWPSRRRPSSTTSGTSSTTTSPTAVYVKGSDHYGYLSGGAPYAQTMLRAGMAYMTDSDVQPYRQESLDRQGRECRPLGTCPDFGA